MIIIIIIIIIIMIIIIIIIIIMIIILRQCNVSTILDFVFVKGREESLCRQR